MDFGKLHNIENVDFSIPEDHPDTLPYLQRLPASQPQIYLASPVWTDKGFVGKIYPENAKNPDYLYHYAKQFNAIELNTTYYGVNPSTLLKWKSMASEGFMFCPKIPKRISHDMSLVNTRVLTQQFCDQIKTFGAHLGPAWLLLPPHFNPYHFEDLERFLNEFPKDTELGIEFRHEEWFANRKYGKAAFDLMERHHASTIITDVSGRRDVLHMRLTSPTLILRFVGNKHHPTDNTRLTAWAARITDWLSQGLQTVYVFFHQPQEHLTVENAIHFAEELERLSGVTVKAPKLIEKLPEQGSLF